MVDIETESGIIEDIKNNFDIINSTFLNFKKDKKFLDIISKCSKEYTKFLVLLMI